MLVFVYWRLRTQIRCAATVRNCPMGALVSGAIVMELNKRYSTYCILGSVLFCIFDSVPKSVGEEGGKEFD